MLGRAVPVVVMLMSLAFAGCLGGDPAVAPAAEEGITQDNTTLKDGDAKSAPDGRGDISAFKETNRTESGSGGMTHGHDYWGGETRKVLLTDDMHFVPLPVQPCRADGQCYPAGTSIADIDLPEPILVYEGTEKLEVVFNDLRVFEAGVAIPNPSVTMAFDYLTAADDANEFRTGATTTKAGEPVIIDVKPTEADMPHQVKSLWIFRIYTKEMTSGADSAGSVSVEFNFTVTAVKGRAIVDWPPHPNLYADKTERTILDGGFMTNAKGWAEYWKSGEDANWVYPDRVISYGTESIEITITKKSYTSTNPTPPDFFYLEYRNASYLSKLGNGDLSGARLQDDTTDGESYHFTIPVEPYGMDTPYGQTSRWAFRFMARYGDMDGTTCPAGASFQQFLQGCQWLPYTVEYDMKIVAHGKSTETGANADPNAPTA